MKLNKSKSTLKFVGTVGFVLAAIVTSASAAGVSWTYSGKTGPSHWKDIDPTNHAACVDGTAQSPINIVNPTKMDLVNPKFSYIKSEAGIFNNGHSVEAEPLGTNKSTVTISNTVYNFAQLHFHAPSEHQITGLHYPAEVHFVNKSNSGKLAVVGVFVKAGSENKAWKKITDSLTIATSDPEATKVEIDWAKLLPVNKATIRYDGSLTTPGCSEGVKWNVFTSPITMSQNQINQFLEAYSGNNRPVQPLNNRPVRVDSTPLR
jgi:carbonic anhydrase